MSKQNKDARLVVAPRLYINAAVIFGGAVGFLVQDALNIDNIGAFIITGAFCFGAVILVNVAWLIHVRRNEKSHRDAG